MPNCKQLDRVCGLVRRAADEELMSRFESVSARLKADGSVVTEADLAMQSRLQSELAEHWPDYLLLGEEMPAAEQERMLASGRVLCGASTHWTVLVISLRASPSLQSLWP